jgi:hypothetical protein
VAARAFGVDSVHDAEKSASAQTAANRVPAAPKSETVERGCPRSLHDMRR